MVVCFLFHALSKLEKKFEFNNLKPVVLGHWGACPGVNFLYAHFCRYIKLSENENYLTLGSGHAAPALLANLYLEESLGEIYSDLSYGRKGLFNLISNFGVDARLQTEISVALPGVINAGGELGVALACAIGSIINNPQKSNFCIIGDGEFEAGATIQSLLCKEFLTPQRDGFLILAVNLNQYKMGSRSLLSTWSDNRIEEFFSALGIKSFFCELYHNQMGKIFSSILKMHKNWIDGNSSQIPVIVLKSKKGATGPEKIGNKQFVGARHSHKVSDLKYPNPKAGHVQLIEEWLRSYKPEKLFQKNGFPVKEITDNFPVKKLRIGRMLEIDRQRQEGVLNNSELINLIKKEVKKPGLNVSSMKVIANAINQLKKKKNKIFMIFSPDEAVSNGLGEIVEQNKIRENPNKKSSIPICIDDGIIEILNENCCHGMLQGYNQTGRDGVYVTYEAFAPITASLISQYYKLLRISNLCQWRAKAPSLKYILSSLGWRNCYTHQNPDLLNTLLSKTNRLIDVYFPSDANQALACFVKMFRKNNSIQIQVTGKTDFKVLRSMEQAFLDVEKGFWTIEYGLKRGETFYIIAIGDYMVKEAVDACTELVAQYKNLHIRVIALICSEIFYNQEKLKLFFDKESNQRNVIVSCTGYTTIFKGLFSNVFDVRKWIFLGYEDSFSLQGDESVLEANEVSKSSLIRHVEQNFICC